MVTSRLASAVQGQGPPSTQIRTATVKDVLAPVIGETDLVTGWQVLLDFGGGEVRRAGVASSYNPIPGDVVTCARYLNTLFVIDKVTAGNSGLEPGGRVAYGYSTVTGTYCTATSAAEVELSGELSLTFACRNGAAYQVHLYTGYATSTAASWAMFRMRQATFNSGIDIGEWYRQPSTAGPSIVFGFEGTMLIRNDTGVDFNVRIVPTLTAPTGVTATAFCTVQTRAFCEITVKGSSKLYPHAAALAVPPDVT